MSFGPERIARPVYCYPSYASVPRSASNHHVSCLSGFFFQTLSASSTHLSSLSRFGCHTCSSHSSASRSEAIDVITKSGYRLFHARNYFFTKFQKNIKNILSSLLCNVAAAKKILHRRTFQHHPPVAAAHTDKYRAEKHNISARATKKHPAARTCRRIFSY